MLASGTNCPSQPDRLRYGVQRVEVVTSGRQPEAHHELAAHEVVLLLETDPHRGLAEAEACSRRERYGPNALPQARRAGPLARVGHQVNDPLIYVLLAAGAVTVALGEHVDAAVIFGVVALTR